MGKLKEYTLTGAVDIDSWDSALYTNSGIKWNGSSWVAESLSFAAFDLGFVVEPDGEIVSKDVGDYVYISGQGGVYVYSGTNTIIVSSSTGGSGFTPHVYPDDEDVTADGGNKINFSSQGGTYVYSSLNTIVFSSSTGSAEVSSQVNLYSGLTSDDDIYHDGAETSMYLSGVKQEVLKSGAEYWKAYESGQIALYTSSDVTHDSTTGFVSDEHINHADGTGFFSGTNVSGGTIIGTWNGDEIAQSYIGEHGNTEHDQTYFYQHSDVDHDQTTNFASAEHVSHLSGYFSGSISSNSFTFGGITSILDQDDMSSDSNTALATQQSIKKYVDDTVEGAGGYTDEQAQDAIGENVGVGLDYNDGTAAISVKGYSTISSNAKKGQASGAIALFTSSDVDHDNVTNTHNLTTDIDHNSITNNHNLTTDIDHNSITNNHNLTTDIDHDTITNNHNLTTDIDHDTITNNHNLTTDIDHDELTNFVAAEHVSHLSGYFSGSNISGGTIRGTTIYSPTIRGGDGSEDISIHANASAYPYLKLWNGSHAEFRLDGADNFRLRSNNYLFFHLWENNKDTVIKGQTSSQSDLYMYPTTVDAYPYQRLTGSGNIEFHVNNDNKFIVYSGANDFLQIYTDDDDTIIKGADDAGHDLHIYANANQSVPRIELQGNSDAEIYIPGTNEFRIKHAGLQSVTFKGTMGGSTYSGQICGPTTNTGDTLIIKANETDAGPEIKMKGSGNLNLNTVNDAPISANTGIHCTYISAQTGNIGHEYMVPIWAEENAGLATGGYEWAFGNGANSAADDGVVIYVPTGYECHCVAMSLKLGATPTEITVELVLNSTPQGSNCDVTCTATRAATNDSFTPISISNGDYICFETSSVDGTTSGPNVVTAWLRYRKA